MSEPIANTEPQSQKLLTEDHALPEKLLRWFSEKPVISEGALERNVWLEKLSNAVEREKTLVVILDLVGASKLGENFSQRIQQVFNGIEEWKASIAEESEMETTGGRRIEIKERKTGEDEIIFFVCPKPDSDSTESLTGLQEKIKEEVGIDGVYIGASENSTGTDIQIALRTADIGLKRCKQKAKQEGELSPKIAIVNPNGQVSLEDKIIDPQELSITKPNLPAYVVCENAIDTLRTHPGPAFFLSPTAMKEINADKGMTGGDLILAQLAETIHQLLIKKGIVSPQIFKIGTTFVIPQVSFLTGELEEISADLPKGLTYSKATLPSSSK